MSLTEIISKAWTKTHDNLIRKRYLVPSNYVSDIGAGTVSRTPYYIAIDTVVVGASPEKAIGSAVFGLGISVCGWSLAYIMGNSIVAEGFGKTYEKHKGKIDAVYSSVLTFGFGMCVNWYAGYTLKQAIAASTLRATLALPLGPVTRYYTDAFREVRDEPSITPQGASFRGKGFSYALPRIAAMVALPIALMLGALSYHAQTYSDKPKSAIVSNPKKL